MTTTHDAFVDKAHQLAESTAGQFTADEEAYLRAYSENRARIESLIAVGRLRPGASIAEQGEALRWASGVFGKAERLGAATVAGSTGCDLIYGCSRLREVCDSDILGVAVKGLQLLFKIHGVTERTQVQRQVALVFDQSRGKSPTHAPATLPFTLPNSDYAVFSEIHTETS